MLYLQGKEVSMRSSGRKECSFSGCGRAVKARGYCNGHYQQAKAGKELKPLQVKRDPQGRVKGRSRCSFNGCKRDALCWGLCDGHYQQKKAGRGLQPIQVIHAACTIEGCDSPHEARGWCKKHYDRWAWHGDPLALSRRDPSVVEERDNHLAVHLGGKWAEEDGGVVALVSLEDRSLVEGRSWWMTADDYVECKIDGSGVSMHRFILRLKRGDPRQGDHINGNRLDNRRENLRIVTFEQNMQNKKVWAKSGHRNVYGPHPRTGAYRVIVTKEGKRYYGGRHKDVALAVAAAQELRDRLFSHHNEARASSE
jgi:hypothetical protein